MEYDVTAVTVFCMNDEYIKICLSSFMDLYPKVRTIVVDNSSPDHACANILRNLWSYGQITLIENGENLGHGTGLIQGIEKVKTKYVLLFDSDVHFKTDELLPDMLALMDEDTYGVGYTMWHGYGGRHVRPHSVHEPQPEGSMRFMHPVCALISMEQYVKWPPIDSLCAGGSKHHGAPTSSIMEAIDKAKMGHIIKHLPESAYVDCKYWHHTSGGVRLALRKIAQDAERNSTNSSL